MRRGTLLVLGTAALSGVAIFLNSFAVKMAQPSVFTFQKNFLVAIALMAVLALGRADLKSLPYEDAVGSVLDYRGVPSLVCFHPRWLWSMKRDTREEHYAAIKEFLGR